jgi:hypothetical protein
MPPKKKTEEPEKPSEFDGKSVEELRSLVAQYERDLDSARSSRNKAQAEHASIQSFCDGTREEIRELDMLIENKEMLIENAEENNASELNVYKQKANFVKYCHDSKLKETLEQNETKMMDASSGHVKYVQIIEDVKANMKNELDVLEDQKAKEMAALKQASDAELEHAKMKLDADVKLFEQRCEDQYLELIHELDSRRAAQLKSIHDRKEMHEKNLTETHNFRCEEMRAYYYGVERQQEIDIEDLEAEIRRLKKVAIEHEADSKHMKESNDKCGEELNQAIEMVKTLATQTRDKDKNATSFQSTKLRLAAARKAIVEATLKYKLLQEKYVATEKERDDFEAALKDDVARVASATEEAKAKVLRVELAEKENSTSIIHRHLQHTLGTAGIDNARSDTLLSTTQDFIHKTNQDLEKLHISVFNATKSYNELLRLCRKELELRGIPKEQIDSIDVLDQQSNE